MNVIQCGSASVSFHIDNDGMLRVEWHGLLVPANAGALSALLLRAAADADAQGVIGTLEKALLALPPIHPRYYSHVPETLRFIPVAFVVSAEQAPLYQGASLAAAEAGVLRHATRSMDGGDAWLRQQTLALAANRLWWAPEVAPMNSPQRDGWRLSVAPMMDWRENVGNTPLSGVSCAACVQRSK